MNEQYVMMTPIEPVPEKIQHLRKWRRGIERQIPLPEKVGVVTSKEVFDKHLRGNPLYTFVAEHPSMNKERIDRIGEAREDLRQWFSEQCTEEYGLLLDSDIELLDPDAYLKMAEQLSSKTCLLLCNGIELDSPRNGRQYTYFLACALIDRRIIDASRFCVLRIRDFPCK